MLRRERLDQSSPRVNPGIGLKNTQARLQTIFGANHQFELINDGGLSVRIRLPMSFVPPTPNLLADS